MHSVTQRLVPLLPVIDVQSTSIVLQSQLGDVVLNVAKVTRHNILFLKKCMGACSKSGQKVPGDLKEGLRSLTIVSALFGTDLLQNISSLHIETVLPSLLKLANLIQLGQQGVAVARDRGRDKAAGGSQQSGGADGHLAIERGVGHEGRPGLGELVRAVVVIVALVGQRRAAFLAVDAGFEVAHGGSCQAYAENGDEQRDAEHFFFFCLETWE